MRIRCQVTTILPDDCLSPSINPFCHPFFLNYPIEDGPPLLRGIAALPAPVRVELLKFQLFGSRDQAGCVKIRTNRPKEHGHEVRQPYLMGVHEDPAWRGPKRAWRKEILCRLSKDPRDVGGASRRARFLAQVRKEELRKHAIHDHGIQTGYNLSRVHF